MSDDGSKVTGSVPGEKVSSDRVAGRSAPERPGSLEVSRGTTDAEKRSEESIARGQGSKRREAGFRLGRESRPKAAIGPGSRKKDSAPPDPVAAKAAEIAKRSGLPLDMAKEVASGACTINEALHRLMRGDKADRLTRAHGLSRSAAMAIVDGKSTLDEALLMKGMHECEYWQPDRSVLLDLRASGQQACFFVFGEEPWPARVTAIEKYEVVLAPEGALEERRLLKHDLRLVSPELVAPEVVRLMGMDAGVAGLGLGPSTSYRDRFRSSKRILFAHHRDRIPTRVVLRDGAVLTGFVGWFGKYEFELQLIDPRKAKPGKAKPVGPVVVFRHAMHGLGPIG